MPEVSDRRRWAAGHPLAQGGRGPAGGLRPHVGNVQHLPRHTKTLLGLRRRNWRWVYGLPTRWWRPRSGPGWSASMGWLGTASISTYS